MRTYTTVGYKKRHYEDVARVLGENLRIRGSLSSADAALNAVTEDFIRLFSADNGRFDDSRFRARIAEYAEGSR